MSLHDCDKYRDGGKLAASDCVFVSDHVLLLSREQRSLVCEVDPAGGGARIRGVSVARCQCFDDSAQAPARDPAIGGVRLDAAHRARDYAAITLKQNGGGVDRESLVFHFMDSLVLLGKLKISFLVVLHAGACPAARKARGKDPGIYTYL